jgi:uncharacterized coiled-coil protein SlyX
MPDPTLTALAGTFVAGKILTADFLGGIIGNLLASAGYDLGKAGLNNLGSRLRELWQENGQFKNHDLLRALRFAECQAMVGVCEICLVEDYESHPNLIRAFVMWPDALPFLLNPEIRLIAKIRRDFHALAQETLNLSPAELEAQAAAKLTDIEPLVKVGRELGSRRQPSGAAADAELSALRERLTHATRESFAAAVEADLFTSLQFRLRLVFRRPDEQTQGVSILDKLVARVDRHWFAFFCFAFREVLRDPEDKRFAKAREAFKLDKLSGNAPRNFDELERRLAVTNQKLDGLPTQLTELRAFLAKAQRERRLARRETKRQFNTLTARLTEISLRLDDLAAGQHHIAAVVTETHAVALKTQDTLEKMGEKLEPPGDAPEPLPPPRDCLARREEKKLLVRALLAEVPRPLPVLGAAGIGKSTLTIYALHHRPVKRRYGARRFFVRCEGLMSAETLVQKVALQLGLPKEARNQVGILAHFEQAESRPALLVLDNFETPWQAETKPVNDFCEQLAKIRGLALVISVRLNELPLNVHWQEPIQPPPLDLSSARWIFRRLAPRITGSQELLDELLDKMGGVPLAITLLAGVAAQEGDLSSVKKRWEAEKMKLLQLLGSEHPDLNWRSSLNLSLKSRRMQRNAAARRLLSVLAWLPDGMAEADRETLFPGDGRGAATELRNLALAYEEAGRLRVLPPIRESVKEEQPPEEADLTHAISHYTFIATRGQDAGTEKATQAIERLTPEVANIETMLALGLQGKDFIKVVQAAPHWGEFVRFTALGTARPLELAAEKAKEFAEWLAAANCIQRLGDIALARSDYDTATSRYNEALPLYQKVRGTLGEANCIQGLGDIALARSDTGQAREKYRQALALYEQIEEPYSIGVAHYRLALISDDEAARQFHVRAARAAWESIDRPDLVQILEERFGAAEPET